MKNYQSKATKVFLATLMTASIAVPAFAESASASTAVTTTAATEIAAQQEKEVTFSTFKPGTTEPQPAISTHLEAQGKIIQKEGKDFAQLIVLAKSASMIAGFQTKQGDAYTDAVATKNEDGTITYEFPLVAGETTPSKIHVVVPAANMDKWYDFDLLATEKEAVVTKQVPVTVYQDGTAKESIMKDYIASEVELSKVDGKNIVVMTIPQGQYVQDFQIEGKPATLVSDKEAKEKKYSFEVADPKQLINAEIHVIVNEGPVNYDSKHKVQLGLGVDGAVKPVENPFSDIDNNNNKEAILALYSKGIVKVNEGKFNPQNNISRSQFALMVARALNLTTGPDAGFKDLGNMTDKERLNAINALAEVGIVKKQDNFNPSKSLTRQQGALMLHRAMNYAAGKELTGGDTKLPFYADSHAVTTDEAQKAFALLYHEKIMTGSPQADGTVRINAGSNLTRSQMAKILYGSLEHIEK